MAILLGKPGLASPFSFFLELFRNTSRDKWYRIFYKLYIFPVVQLTASKMNRNRCQQPGIIHTVHAIVRKNSI